jgi:hypothetical protein
MKRVAEHSRRVVGIPIVPEVIVVPVPLTVIPVQVQHITITIRAPQNCNKVILGVTLEYSSGHISLRDLKSLNFITKYLHFL